MSIDEWLQRKREEIKSRERRHSEKVEWKKVRCPVCGREVQYVPAKDFTGQLKCPHCQSVFQVPNLDRFLK